MYEFIKIELNLKELDKIQELSSSLETTNFYTYFPEIGRVLNEINITQMYIEKQGSKKKFVFIISFSNEQNIQIRKEFKNKKLADLIQIIPKKCKKTLRKLKEKILSMLPCVKELDKDMESIMKDFSKF